MGNTSNWARTEWAGGACNTITAVGPTAAVMIVPEFGVRLVVSACVSGCVLCSCVPVCILLYDCVYGCLIVCVCACAFGCMITECLSV